MSDVIKDATQSVKSTISEIECISQGALNQETKALKNITKEITKTQHSSVAGKIKTFPSFNKKLEEHIFSPDHIKKGIMKLGPTKEAINDKFIQIIREADIKNLLKEGPNNIFTRINDQDVTIRAFVKKDHIVSYDGFIGFSNRRVDNKIYL